VARAATTTSLYLAEGPTWDPVRERILWVNVLEGTVYEGSLLPDGAITVERSITTPDTASAVAVAHDGTRVIAGTHRLHYVDADGTVTSGRILIDEPQRRFNDGKPDPSGRLVVGTKGPGGELLMRIEEGERVQVLDDDLSLSNGLGWSSDGTTLYNIDTWSRRVYAREYDPQTGDTGERRLFAEISGGYPDGMTVDAEDHVWVAVWGGGRVDRLAPTGEVVDRIDLPAPHTSCPTFAGARLDTLVITTATEDLDDAQLAQYPLSGRLFTVTPGVLGSPPNMWSGTP